MVYLNRFPINHPEVIVSLARDRFDADGRQTEPVARTFVRDHRVGVARFMRQLATNPG